MGPIQPHIWWIQGLFPRGKVAGAWSWPLTSNYWRGHEYVNLYIHLATFMPITVAARSKARNVFARSNAGIVGANPTRGMDVCVRLFSVSAVLYVGRGVSSDWSPVQGVLPTMHTISSRQTMWLANYCYIEAEGTLATNSSVPIGSIEEPGWTNKGTHGSPYDFACLLRAGFLLGLLFNPENGGDIFLRNITFFRADYMAVYPRR
jgi:hypothetical protein